MVHARNVKPPWPAPRWWRSTSRRCARCPASCGWSARATTSRWCASARSRRSAARRQLKCQWRSRPRAPFPASDDLFDYMRGGDAGVERRTGGHRRSDAGVCGAATRSRRDYDVPFQGHTAIGPAHAMADPSNDQLTIYSNDMKSYGLRNGVAEFLKMPRDRVRVVWMDGPQAYGRTAADDAGFEAAFLAKELGRPVRRAVDARRRDGVGHQGPGLCGDHARRPRRRRQPRRARLRRARRRPQSPRLQRARHRAHRPAHRAAQGHPGARPRLAAVGHVRRPATVASRPTSSACRWSGKRRFAPATCATPTARRSRSRPSRSSTNWRRRPRPIRSAFRLAAAHRGHRATTAASSAPVRLPSSRRRLKAYGWDAAAVAASRGPRPTS